jgi:hypothetical protein
MANYADNNWYLDIDGTNVSAYVKRVSFEPKINTVDTTAGSGTDDVTRAVGLKDRSFSFDIMHTDAASWALSLIAVGVHTITYGLEGNATGKPKHVQSFIITAAPHETKVEKDAVMYSVTADQAAAPTVDMFASGVWS